MAYKEGEPQAGAILCYNQAMCYYMHASRNHSFTGQRNLLQWRAMLDMKAAGVKKYSFVGCRINEDENSKYHGIQRFKERFGG
jgi:lipid II:glycine glycyltransferase (peptidoglycan interpeptide bridge formation enzyme)